MSVEISLECAVLTLRIHRPKCGADLHAFSYTLVDENLNVNVTIEIAALGAVVVGNRMGRAISDWDQDSS
jgi:hypothetical protein